MAGRIRPIAFFWAGCEYDHLTEELVVTFTVYRKTLTDAFKDGRPYQYRYFNVPTTIGSHFINDDANGEFYNGMIRGHYYYERIR